MIWDVIKQQWNIGKTTGKLNGDKYFSSYRSFIAPASLGIGCICLAFGAWKYALACWLFWHFHMIIAENYWRIRTLEYHLEKQEQKKDGAN